MTKKKELYDLREMALKSKPFLGLKAGSTDHRRIVYGGRHYTREEVVAMQKRFRRSRDPILKDEAYNKLQRRIDTYEAAVAEKQKKKKKSSHKLGVLTGRRGKNIPKGDITKKMNMGGVMRNRGGTFKGVF